MLVSKDKEEGITEFIFVQHALQLFPGLDDTIPIVAIDDEDDTLGVLEVMSPERTDLVLSTDIPHGKLNVLVLDGLDVETFTNISGQLQVPLQTTWPVVRPNLLIDGTRGGAMTDRL